MTFEQVSQGLPNGFHDARILQILLDSMERSVILKISVDVSTDDGTEGEKYRLLSLKASCVSLFFVEPPDPTYHFSLNDRGISASGYSVAVGQNPVLDPLLKALPPEHTAYRFFFDDWNSFLYVAAKDVAVSWEELD